MDDHKQEKHDSATVSALKDIVAGMFRGMSQIAIGHPLDTIKVRLQTQSTTEPAYTGAIDCFRKTYRQEGVLGLYRGASSPLAMSAIYSAVLFFAYGQSKRLVQNSQGDPLSFNRQLVAGMLTGSMASMVEGPMDLFKCKMQVQKLGISKDPFVYRHAMDAGMKIFSNYGIRGVYRGIDATLMRNIPGSAIYFLVYELLKKQLGSTQFAIMTAGGIGGIAFWISVYPLDVLKSTIQADSVSRSHRVYSGAFDCAKKIYKANGIKAFWRGFPTCLVRAFPVNAISFLTYEYVRGSLG